VDFTEYFQALILDQLVPLSERESTDFFLRSSIRTAGCREGRELITNSSVNAFVFYINNQTFPGSQPKPRDPTSSRKQILLLVMIPASPCTAIFPLHNLASGPGVRKSPEVLKAKAEALEKAIHSLVMTLSPVCS